MKKWFKRGLFALVFLVIVTLVGAAIFLLTFDPNAYKAKVEQVVYEHYQRHLSIDGDIELSLFPRIGLSVEQVSLTDKDSEAVFASMDSARFAVAVWPLLWNKLVVDHVAVSGFKVWLKRDEAGDFNFTDLMQDTDSPPKKAWLELSPIAQANAQSSLKPDVSQAEFQIDIAGLDLKEGEIHFSDSASNTQLRVVNLELNTGRMTFGQPFDVIFKGAVKGEQPVADAAIEGQTVLKLEPHLSRYAAQRMNLSLVGQIGAYQANSSLLRGGVELLSLTKEVRGRNIELVTQGHWQGGRTQLQKTNFSFVVPAINFKTDLRFFTTEKLQLRAAGLLPTVQNQPEHRVELALDIPRLYIEPEQISSEPIALSFKQSQGANLFGFSVRAKDFSGTLQQLQLQQLQIELASKVAGRAWKVDTTAAAQWQQDSATLSWQDQVTHVLVEDEGLDPNPAQATLSGLGQWQWLERQGHFEGEWQSANTQAKLDADLAKQENQWLLTTSVQATEVDATPWLVSTSPLAPTTAKVPAIPAAYYSVVDLIPWSALNVDLQLQSDRLKWNNFDLQQVNLKAQKNAQSIRLQSLQSELFNGHLQAEGMWQAETTHAELKANLTDIDLQLYSQAVGSIVSLEGKGQIKADLQTEGSTMAARRAALKGTLQLAAENGAIKGWGFWQHLEQTNEAVRNAFSGQAQDLNETVADALATDFTKLTYTLGFEQGQGIFKTLQWQADGIKMTAEPHSYVDLVNRQMDLNLRFDLQKKTLPEAQQHLAPYASHPLFVRFSGPWNQPFYRVQWQRLEQPIVVEAIDQGLLGLLGLPDQHVIQQPQAKVSTVEGAAKSISNTLKDLLKK